MATKIEFSYTAHVMPYTNKGVTITSPEQHKFHLAGTPVETAYFWFYESNTKPTWLEYDTAFYLGITKTGDTNKVRFVIQTQTGTTVTNRVSSPDSIGFTIPSGSYSYFRVGLMVNSNAGSISETIYPYLEKGKPFTPRLNTNGMSSSPYWYNSSYNPFYPTYGLPNCTCYAWGRWYEIMGRRPSGLSTGNAENWWYNTTGYARGQVPQLGAIICFADGPYSGLGHVAVVEKISAGGLVTFSNSAYNGSYFYLRTGNASNNYGYERGYRLQGFLYLPDSYVPIPTPEPEPEPTPTETGRLPWIYWLRRRPF